MNYLNVNGVIKNVEKLSCERMSGSSMP